ncbi:MAG: flagellar export chaperone FlgN [Deltaproteobacteria bacterium]|nr:flagellar export chaperone FlgN [Deltaproteobacteria bacterium]
MKIKILTETLSEQQKLLEELLALLVRETGELTGLHIDAMAEINGLKEDVAARIEAHTTQLRQVIGEALAGAGLPPGATLGDLAALMKKQGDTGIPRLHVELNMLAERVRQAAAMNREIAERFAATVNQSLGFLARILNQSNLYGVSGGYQQRPAGAVMINMEA